MSDDHDRRLADIEKRLARLERAAEKPEVYYGGVTVHDMAYRNRASTGAQAVWSQPRFSTGLNGGKQWCPCGRDVCRAPDCPSHKPDPLGR
jgi:hypothetical protein